MVETPPVDREGQLAWVARHTVQELAAAGARLDIDEIVAALAATYEHYHLEQELLGRVRAYVARWVERVSQPGWQPRDSSASKPQWPQRVKLRR